MKKTLVLRAETLTELGGDDLREVVGADGSALTCFSCIKCYTGITVCGLCDPHAGA